MDVYSIFILKFQRLKFAPLNLSMTLAPLLLNDVIVYSNIHSKNSKSYFFTTINPTQIKT